MRVAIVHDWLDTWGGSERVLKEILELFPAADLFAVVDFLSDADRQRLARPVAATTFIQKLPFARRHFRKYLGLMQLAVEQLDVQGYDLVISSCHAVSKAVLTGPDQLHVCMCYSPPRYAWDLQAQYLRESHLERGVRGFIARRMLHHFRIADLRASYGVDHFIAISHYIARRIRKCYRRESTVVYPPVEIPAQIAAPSGGSDYITVSRLVPYKRVDLLIDAFNALPERTLHVVGAGPEMEGLAARAGANVRFHGALPDDERDRLMDRAAAFIYAAEEDFGIAPLEAQGRGLPVIAYERGGTGETIVGLNGDAPTGVLFARQSADSIVDAVREFERNRDRISASACRRNAERFSTERFRAELNAYFQSISRDHATAQQG
jgi:glycosyltransferase involved in cell wall biosynthesis